MADSLQSATAPIRRNDKFAVLCYQANRSEYLPSNSSLQSTPDTEEFARVNVAFYRVRRNRP
jgi:hypothetical protein